MGAGSAGAEEAVSCLCVQPGVPFCLSSSARACAVRVRLHAHARHHLAHLHTGGLATSGQQEHKSGGKQHPLLRFFHFYQHPHMPSSRLTPPLSLAPMTQQLPVHAGAGGPAGAGGARTAGHTGTVYEGGPLPLASGCRVFARPRARLRHQLQQRRPPGACEHARVRVRVCTWVWVWKGGGVSVLVKE